MTESSQRTEQLCVNLGEVLHAIAQPLTILQVRLDMAGNVEMKKDDLQALVGDSAQEVVRLCRLFDFLQGFVAAETTPPMLSAHPLGAMLEHVAEGLALFYKEAGIGLRLNTTEAAGTVCVDQIRLYQALSRVLLVAYEGSIAKDTVEMMGCVRGAAARVAIRNRAAMVPLGREAGLKMALAQANIARQGGSLTWTEEPFDVQIELCAAAGDGR